MRRQRRFIIAALMVSICAAPVLASVQKAASPETNSDMLQNVDRRRKAAKLKEDRYWRETLAAMAKVDRANFVPLDQKHEAYKNHPLPIGYDQTISDPFIVAVMTSILKPEKSHHVLEIGTGSGYQAAILGLLVAEVRTIEIVEPLADRGRETLFGLGYRNVFVRSGDGYDGWPEAAPYDAIIVTAGAPYIPQPLLDQLKPGGRMIIPLGKAFWDEELVLVTKSKSGRVTQKALGPIMFVDFTGKIRTPRKH